MEFKLPAIMDRRASIIGKVLLANTTLLSQLWHLAWVLKENKAFIKKAYKIVNKAITGRDHRIWTIDKLVLPPEKGGLSLGNIDNKLNALKLNN
jgi:hypothetical protein